MTQDSEMVVIETERPVLRQFVTSDAKAMEQVFRDEEIMHEGYDYAYYLYSMDIARTIQDHFATGVLVN